MNATDSESFRAAIHEQRWGDAADMVRKYTRDSGWRDINSDTLANWLSQGDWSDDPATWTPRTIANEWDTIT